MGGQVHTSITDVSDDVGFDTTEVAYPWLRVEGTDETQIEGATAPAHTITSRDAGKQLKVRIAFEDDAGHEETVTSAAYPDGGTITETSAPDASAELTATTFGNQVLLTWRAPTYAGGAEITGYWVEYTTDVEEPWSRFDEQVTGSTGTNVSTLAKDTILRVVAKNAAGESPPSNIAAAGNRPAAGLRIDGTQRVGETLTAGTTSIYDANGTDAPEFTYVWYPVDGTVQ